MPGTRRLAATTLGLLLVSLLIAACGATPIQQAADSGSPTETPDPTATPDLPVSPSPAQGVATQHADLPPYLLSVTPKPGETVGLDLRMCATFDLTVDGLHDWEGPIWFEVAGVEVEHRGVTSPDSSQLRDCSNFSLRTLLEDGTLDSVPQEGPMELAVHHQDVRGSITTHSWQVNFSLDDGEAPPEVLRIREMYRTLQLIDEGKPAGQESIAGYFLDGDVLHVYLLDNADPNTVRAQVEAALGDAVPAGGIDIVHFESPPDRGQVIAWISELQEPVWGAQDIQITGGSGGCCNIWNRATFDVSTVYSAHLLRELLAETSVPQEAVFIEASRTAQLEEPSNGLQDIATSLEFDSIVKQGTALRVDVVWTNVGDSTVEYTYNPYLPFNLIAFTSKGDAVWASYAGGAVPLPAQMVTLAPGEEHRFTRYWELVDEDGFTLPPGEYLVQAQTDVWPGTNVREDALISEAYPLQIER